MRSVSDLDSLELFEALLEKFHSQMNGRKYERSEMEAWVTRKAHSLCGKKQITHQMFFELYNKVICFY